MEDASRAADVMPAEARRLIFLGEALNAAHEYCGLADELSDQTYDTVELMNTALRTMVRARPCCAKEDFALYVLSLFAERIDSDDRYRTFRQGALRYLDDNRSRLSPEILALYPALGTVAALEPNSPFREGETTPGTGLPDEQTLHHSRQIRTTVSNDFVQAYETLRRDLRARTRAEASAMPVASGNPGPETIATKTDLDIETELRRIRAQRERAVRQVRTRTRKRYAWTVTFVLMACSLGYALLSSATASGF